MASIVQANVTIQGSITTLGTFGQTTYAPVDLGVNSLSLATGNLTSLITTSSSAPTGFAAASEGALVFPGTANAYISFGTSGVPLSNSNIYSFGDFVVEAWVNPSSFSTYPSIIACTDTSLNNPYWSIYIDTVGRPNWFSIWNNISTSMTSTGALSTGTWQHVSVIYQSTSRRVQIYINGQPQTLGFSGSGATASGTVGTWTSGGGIVPVSNQPLLMGQYGTQTFTGSLTNLRVTTGPGAMYLYNNNAFTPSTSPLFPASNVTGGSLTTRLLVRVPLTKGQTNISKIGPASGVLAFPPAPMTSYATNLTGLSPYGQGTYVASASSDSSGYPAWGVFNKNASTFWSSNQVDYTTYNATTSSNTYSGSVTTVDVNGTSYAGQWVQVQSPSSVSLTGYTIQCRGDQGNGTGEPKAWWVLGSRDGTSWYLTDQRSGISWSGASSTNSITVQSSQAFTYFRLVVNVIGAGVGAAATNVVVGEWTLNGSIESINVTADGRVGLGVVNPTRALEVAGDIVCTGTVSSGTGLMFRNALYNGDMRISQRGTSFSSLGSVYTLDRWYISQYGAAGNGTVSQIQSGLANFSNALQLAVTSTTVGNWSITQSLETRDVVRFQGQSATVSFWYRIPVNFTSQWSAELVWNTSVDTKQPDVSVSSTSAGSLVLTNTTAWTYGTFTGFVPPTAQALTVRFLAYNNTVNGAQFQVTGVQLEKGAVATPFEVRPYAVELALCQRYYANVSALSGQTLAVATAGNSTCYIAFQVPVTLRATPVIATTGTLQLRTGGADNTITSFAIAGTSQTLVNIQGTLTSSAGNGIVGGLYASTSVSVALNSEL